MNDDNHTDIQDTFKPLDSVTELDDRMNSFLGTLADFHAILHEIQLNTSVPSPIHQHFETAKNLSLYACFAYRFHQVAEFWGFSALEMALRERRNAGQSLGEGNPKTADPPMLHQLLKQASAEGWFNSIAETLRWERAYQKACMDKHINAIEGLRSQPELEGVEWEEPKEEEVRACLDSSDPIVPIVESAKRIRNNLAHGSTTLHPNSAATLRQTARLINAIFDCGT